MAIPFPKAIWQRQKLAEASTIPLAPLPPPQIPLVRLPLISWVILLSSICLTSLAWFYSNKYIHERALDRFEFRAQNIRAAVTQRMQSYEQVLRGAAGLWISSVNVSRQEWQVYVKNAQLENYYPGIQGIGVSMPIKPEELARHLDQVRAEGFPDYRIYPAGERPIYHSIIYIEPFDWRNKRAFGYDMYSEPSRREAMNRAIDTGLPSISSRITLVQETDEDVQPGFLYYLPLYQAGMPIETPEQRRQAFYAMIYAAFRGNDLMQGILESGTPDVELEIYDGDYLTAENLLYSSAPATPQSSESAFSRSLALPIGGHRWTLYVQSKPGFISVDERVQSALVASAGLLVDFLLFFILAFFARQRQTALRLARKMSDEAIKTEQHFRKMIEVSPNALIMLDEAGVIGMANKGTENLFGYGREELLGQSVAMLLPKKMHSEYRNLLKRIAHGPDSRHMLSDNLYGLHKDGSKVAVELGLTPIPGEQETQILATINDVRERKQVEQAKERYMADLERSNRELDSFTYIASHDLKSPLRGIAQLADWIEEDLGEGINQDIRGHLDLMRSRVMRLTKMLDSLLDYFRAGRLKDNLERLDINEMVTACFELLSPPAGFKLEILRPLPVINTLKAPLELVFRNLFSNVLKHHDLDHGVIQVDVVLKADCYEFSVRDDGPGIPKEHHERVFGMFQTLKPRDELESSGMGLALIKRTIEAVGERIILESGGGRGTCFKFSWPRDSILRGRINA